MAGCVNACLGGPCEFIAFTTQHLRRYGPGKVNAYDAKSKIEFGQFQSKRAGSMMAKTTESLQSCASCNLKKENRSKDSNEIYLRNVMKLKGYALGKELGRGSFAVVRKARSMDTKMKHAVKIVDCSKAPEDFVTHFFPRELSIIRKLKHENIVEVVDIVKVNWFTCIVMERASGGDILDYLVKNGPMNDDIANHVFRQALLGLKYCHDQNIAHRDLKCENVLLTEDNVVKIADFGFSRSMLNRDNMRVLSETYCGSAAYAAPEVLQGRPYNPILSDIWSMGIVLYIMLCAVMPFNDSSHRKMLANQRNRRWSFSPDRRAQIPPNCRKLVRLLLEPDITQRATMRMALESPWLKREGGVEFLAGLAKVATSRPTEE